MPISPALSQSSSDSTTLPNSQLRLALQQIEIGRQQVSLLTQQTELLTRRIEVKDSLIENCRIESAMLRLLIDNYKATEGNYKISAGLMGTQIFALQKKVRRQKTSKFFITAGAVVAAAIILLK